MRIVSVVGTRPQLIKAAALFPTLRARHDDVFVDTGQHWDEAMAGTLLRRARPAEAGPLPRDRRRHRGRPGRPHARRARRRPRGREARCRPRLRRHELDARRRPRRGDARHPASLTSRPACGASIGGCPRRRTGSSPITSLAGCSHRHRPRSRISPPKGSARASSSSATSCRTWRRASSAEVRDAGTRCCRRSDDGWGSTCRPAATCSRRSTAPRTGRPTRSGRGRPSSEARRDPDRPVVLALHPGNQGRTREHRLDARR